VAGYEENGYNGFGLQAYQYSKKVNCPVLLQWGDKDMYVTENEINRVYKNLESPRKKMIVYPGANHESLLKYDPVSWQQNVKLFLESLQQ